MTRPVRFNEQKQRMEILVGGTRWRIATEVTCDNCGKDFYKESIEISKYQPTYCSRNCSASRRNHKVWLKRGTGGRGPKWCVICGARFEVYASKALRYSTCGKPECKRENQRQNMLEYHQRKRQELLNRPLITNPQEKDHDRI